LESPSNEGTDIYFDLSMNNKDFYLNFVIFQSYVSPTIVAIDPKVLSTLGGIIKIFTTKSKVTHPLYCKFSYYSHYNSNNSNYNIDNNKNRNEEIIKISLMNWSDGHATCITPTYRLVDTNVVSLDIIQKNRTLYGPELLYVEEVNILTIVCDSIFLF
jgi:hypothetical protein